MGPTMGPTFIPTMNPIRSTTMSMSISPMSPISQSSPPKSYRKEIRKYNQNANKIPMEFIQE
jgi:hypothetical protein